MSRDRHRIVDYLLDELEPEARAAVEARAASDPAFADEIEATRAVIAGLDAMPDEGWAPPEPPPLPPLPGLEAPRRRWSLAPGRPAFALAAIVAALLVAGVSWWAVSRDDGATGGPVLALAPFDEGGPGAAGEARPAGDGTSLSVDVKGLPESTPDTYYELWLIDGTERIVSLGSFQVPASGATTVEVPLPGPLDDYAVIDVSIEPDDGDATHSGRSLLRGPTAQA